MRRTGLALRSLWQYRRTNLGVVLGVAIAAAVLCGALVVGDCIRYSLHHLAELRIGRFTWALPAGDRFLTVDTARKLKATPVIAVAAVVSRPDGSARASDVQLLGVDASFNGVTFHDAGVNATLAAQLGVKPGDDIVLRVIRPSAVPRDLPAAVNDDSTLALRLKVQQVVTDEQMGRFSLRANQVTPATLFVDRDWLAPQLGVADRANLLLFSGAAEPTALNTAWSPADAQLELNTQGDTLELRSARIFMDDAVARAAGGAMSPAAQVLTYFVNSMEHGESSTPYSMVCAGDGPWSRDLPEGSIRVTRWLADDLGIKPGDAVTLRYFVPGPQRQLVVKSAIFVVHDVVDIAGPYADPSLMPAFPGLSDADSCRDWRPGIPIDLGRIRPKDEAYWNQHRGTPKAYITMADGQRLWSNRFGSLTAVRRPAAGADAALIGGNIMANLTPGDLGLAVRNIRAQAHAASAQALDFGQLFLGLSFFLIAAALILTALLFAFAVQQRSHEIGLLLALGWTRGQVGRHLLGEGLVLVAVGAAVGVAGSFGYALGVIMMLDNVWAGAVAHGSVVFHVEPMTLGIGLGSSVLAAVAAMALVLRKLMRQPTARLLAGETVEVAGPIGGAARWRWAGLLLSVMGAAVAVLAPRGPDAAGAFFGAGAALLLAVLCVAMSWLRGAPQAIDRSWSLTAMGLASAQRRAGRSLATVALLACGCFMVVAVGANRGDLDVDANRRSSGTGGFALWGQSSLPILHRLDNLDDLDQLGLDPRDLHGASAVMLRLGEGDDASCLNLNRAQQPAILGVTPAELADRAAFSFAVTQFPDDGWNALDRVLPDDTIPAIGDTNSVQWALGKAVGEVVTMPGPNGQPIRLRIVATTQTSILQGFLIISERQFERLFPDVAGYRVMLIDASPTRVTEVRRSLSRALADQGLALTPAAARLASFREVEQTYLSIFLALGGLGLILGSGGMGAVVLRNVLERRRELALLEAVGFTRGRVARLLGIEHGALLALGAMGGGIAAIVAIWPVLTTPGKSPPWLGVGAILAGVLISGAAWTGIAIRAALRRDVLAALRAE